MTSIEGNTSDSFFYSSNLLKTFILFSEWIMKKANARTNNQFVYPYDLGYWQNLKELFFNDSDGINWKLRKGCHEFSLTVSLYLVFFIVLTFSFL